jgi:hypothetical protein
MSAYGIKHKVILHVINPQCCVLFVYQFENLQPILCDHTLPRALPYTSDQNAANNKKHKKMNLLTHYYHGTAAPPLPPSKSRLPVACYCYYYSFNSHIFVVVSNDTYCFNLV